MIGRKHSQSVEEEVEPKAFDDFELRLGDIMRGERATMGKSLLDVQRELRIKAPYIAAIENCDPDAFDTPGFIAGYVRSYARYLGMDPEEVFDAFCEESGFSVVHGMSAEASVIKKSKQSGTGIRGPELDIFNRPGTPFVPDSDGLFSRIEPGAIGSSLVLLALICGIGFGGYVVLQEVQRVQVAPSEQTPVVLSDLDPLDGVLIDVEGTANPETLLPEQEQTQRADALDRLYRPDALDVPVLVARDAPISTLDPRTIGNFAYLSAPQDAEPLSDSLLVERELALAEAFEEPPVPIVSKDPGPALRMVAVRPSWVRVRAADGTVLLETIMEPGETWDAPADLEDAPRLRTGESGAIYFALNGEYYGPVGDTGVVTSNVVLDVDSLKSTYTVADIAADEALATTVVQLQTALDDEAN